MIQMHRLPGRLPRVLHGRRWLIWLAPLFFLVKGLLWLAIPLLAALWAVE